MLIMKENILNYEAMTNEDTDFPGENSVDTQPARVAKSSTSISELIYSVTNLSDLALFNVDATSGGIEIVDHDAAGAVVLTGTDISITDSNTVHNTGTSDFSVFADGDDFVMYGWEDNQNMGKFTVSGTPTATDLDVAGSPLTASIAGASIKMVRWNDADLAVDEDINYSFCKSWTDYFNGFSIDLDKYYDTYDKIYVDATVKISIYGTTPSLGLSYGGRMRSYGTSQYGSADPVRDNSIRRFSANGSQNIVNRPVNLDKNVAVLCSVSESVALKQLFQFNNDVPWVCLLKRDEDNGLISDEIIYGRPQAPSLIWQKPDQKRYSMTINSIGGYQS